MWGFCSKVLAAKLRLGISVFSIHSLFIVILCLSERPRRFCFFSHLEFSACNLGHFAVEVNSVGEDLGFEQWGWAVIAQCSAVMWLKFLGKTKRKNVRVNNTEAIFIWDSYLHNCPPLKGFKVGYRASERFCYSGAHMYTVLKEVLGW